MDKSLSSLIDSLFPWRTTAFRPSVHHQLNLSGPALTAKRDRRNLEKRMFNLVGLGKRNPDNLLHNYKKLRKHARCLINKSRADNLHSTLPSTPPNSKACWKTVNNVLHRAPPTPPPLTLKSNNLSNPSILSL